jgi:hypothetical protein
VGFNRKTTRLSRVTTWKTNNKTQGPKHVILGVKFMSNKLNENTLQKDLNCRTLPKIFLTWVSKEKLSCYQKPITRNKNQNTLF